MTGNLQADGVQSRQTLFVRYCPGITPQSACVVLPLLYRFSVKSARWLCKICVKNKLRFVEAGEGSLRYCPKETLNFTTPHMKKASQRDAFLYSNAVFSGKVFCYSGFAGECSSRTIAFSTQCCRTLRMRIRYPSISSFRRLPSLGISPSLPMRKPLKVSYSSASENS